MACPHCQVLRDKLEEIKLRHGLDAITRWGENDDVDNDLRKEFHLLVLTVEKSGLTDCRCNCHPAQARTPAKVSAAA